MVINREWNMPDSRTFSIRSIEKLIHKYAYGRVIDPFANSSKIAGVTNDLDTQYDTDYHMDALDFLKIFDDGSVDTVSIRPISVGFACICLIFVVVPVRNSVLPFSRTVYT